MSLGFSCFALLSYCALFSGGLWTGAFFLGVLCHEGGHLGALALLGAPPGQVSLSALGCRITPSPRRSLTWGESAFVSLAGPGANLLAWAAGQAAGWGERHFFLCCLGLGLLHSLPILPLDGGLVLEALLSRQLSPALGETLCWWVSAGLVLPLGILGLLVVFRSPGNFSLLAMSLYLACYLLGKETPPRRAVANRGKTRYNSPDYGEKETCGYVP